MNEKLPELWVRNMKLHGEDADKLRAFLDKHEVRPSVNKAVRALVRIALDHLESKAEAAQ